MAAEDVVAVWFALSLLRVRVAARLAMMFILCMGAMRIIFFQAKDGIRDVAVTGVQTCALPICPEHGAGARSAARARPRAAGRAARGDRRTDRPHLRRDQPAARPRPAADRARRRPAARSEERRGGEECRTWWSPYH